MKYMRQKNVDAIAESPEEDPSILRLVNLAFGLTALLGLMAGVSLDDFLPAKLRFAAWFNKSSLVSVSPFALLAANTAYYLWLPSSFLMMIFWLLGLHRKVEAPHLVLASLGLVCAWLLLIGLFIVEPMLGSGPNAAAVLVMAGIFLVPIFLGVLVGGAGAVVMEFVLLTRHKNKLPPYVPLALVLWALAPPILSMVPILLGGATPNR